MPFSGVPLTLYSPNLVQSQMLHLWRMYFSPTILVREMCGILVKFRFRDSCSYFALFYSKILWGLFLLSYSISTILSLSVGVIHMAGSLHDGLFSSANPESWRNVVDAKARGATLLDKLCRKHRDTVQMFICFSSIVAACGNAGQASYGYANSVLDSICRQRVSDGLHGLSIQWGLVGVGMGSTVEQVHCDWCFL